MLQVGAGQVGCPQGTHPFVKLQVTAETCSALPYLAVSSPVSFRPLPSQLKASLQIPTPCFSKIKTIC